MTKTQALQRLYKALTGNSGRNTDSKVIEDLAVAAENGEIGGGGGAGVAKMTVDSTLESCPIANTGFECMGTTMGDEDFLYPTNALPPDYWSSTVVHTDLPLYKGKGVFMARVGSGFKITTEGDVEEVPEQEGSYVYTGDFTLIIQGDK